MYAKRAFLLPQFWFVGDYAHYKRRKCLESVAFCKFRTAFHDREQLRGTVEGQYDHKQVYVRHYVGLIMHFCKQTEKSQNWTREPNLL